MILHILQAAVDDFSIFTDICIKSKRQWGYSDELIEQWNASLSITPRQIRHSDTWKLVNEHGVIIGFGAIRKENSDRHYQITQLWMLPEYQDKWYSRLLLEQLEKKAENRSTIKVMTDPNTLDFYHKYGYHKIGETEHETEGMKLLILKKIIDRDNHH